MTVAFLYSWLGAARRRIEWRELAGLAVILGVGAIIYYRGARLDPPQLVALGAIACVALAVVLRTAVPRLLGPVFAYDLMRTSRRSRYFLLRGSYSFALLVALFLVYASWFGSASLFDAIFGTTVAADQLPKFATAFFGVFQTVQMAAVLLLTPAFAAGAIAEEKEHHTLDYLLTSDLRNHEIIVGKLASRLTNLALVLLAGLPVLSFVQFLGGVDPNLVLAGFVAAAVTMISVASLGVVNSIYVSTSRMAIFVTYLEIVLYLAGSLLCAPFPRGFNFLAAGNIFVALYELSEAAGAGTLATELPIVVLSYAGFHALVTVICILWGTACLRRETRFQAGGDATVISVAAPDGGRYVVSRPPLFEPMPKVRQEPDEDEPLLWKEVHVEPTFRVPPAVLGLAIFVAVNALCGAAAVFLGGMLLTVGTGQHAFEFSNGWTRMVGLPIACLMLLAVALRAAGGLSLERDRQTLDGLLTTPLEDREILWGKWWGSILSVRKGWWVLGSVWGMGLLTGGVHPLSLPLMVGAWFIFAAFLAGLGLYFSLVSRTTLRATIWTLLAVVGICFGHWALGGLCCGPFLLLAGARSPVFTVFHWYGLTPPATMDAVTFSWMIVTSESRRETDLGVRLIAALLGLTCYAVFALILWQLLNARFCRVTGRVAVDTGAGGSANRR